MAVVNTKATAVTNADSATNTPTPLKVAGGRVKSSIGSVAVANGDSIASTLRFARVHSSWRVRRVLLSNDAIATATADIGILETAANGGAAVDADLFGSAVALTAAQSNIDVTRESGVITVANMEKPLWQLLGLTSDPGKWYDLAATLT
ncbi:MAG TPA: hypothetical protein VGE88_07095, partial [Lysobacter sp.]